MMNNSFLKRVFNIQKKAKVMLDFLSSKKKKNKYLSLNKKIAEQKQIIEENYKIIEEQMIIIEEIQSINNVEKIPSKQRDILTVSKQYMDYDFVFQQTINKEISFNESHPYYNNIKFIKDLIEYYISIEEYEECANLQKLVIK